MKKQIMVNVLLAAAVIGISIIPFFTAKGADFGGADGKAEIAVTEIDKDYVQWFSPLFQPKSKEIESLLFALQAAAGAGIIGYGLGYMHGRRKVKEVSRDAEYR